MTAVRIIVWIARIAGVGALLLGLLFWIVQIDLISVHMLLGIAFGLALLLLSIGMLFTAGMRLLGAIGIVYAFILPIFGLTQTRLLIGNLHWLIQVAHLLLGLGALTLVQGIYTRYVRLKAETVPNVSF